jgi:hypothetical protein
MRLEVAGTSSIWNAVDVRGMEANGDAHDHMLKVFRNVAIDTQEVRAFEAFEAESALDD